MLAHLDASSSPPRNQQSTRLLRSSPVAGTGEQRIRRARRFVIRRFGMLALPIGAVIAATAFAGVRADAEGSSYFTPGNLLVSRSVTIWAVTSTVSGGGDRGADPNKLVSITDDAAATH